MEAKVAKELVCVPMAAVADAHPNTNVQTNTLEVLRAGARPRLTDLSQKPPSPHLVAD